MSLYITIYYIKIEFRMKQMQVKAIYSTDFGEIPKGTILLLGFI